VLDPRAICESCGHTRDWHDRDAIRARLRSDPPVGRPCYREVGGAPCRCGGFRESGVVAVPAGSQATRGPSAGFEIVRVAAIVFLIIVLGLGLLYAYRSQAPSMPEVDISTAIQDINAGRIRAVTLADSKATLEFRDSASHKEQTTVPQPDTFLAKAVSDYNGANRSQPIEVRFESFNQTVGLVSILPSLLVVLLVGGLFYYLMRRRRTS
jgi:FtsH-like protein